MSIPDLNWLVAAAIRDDRQIVIGHHNLHSVYLSREDPDMQSFYANADWIHADGLPLIMLARLAGYRELSRIHRVTYVDWTPLLMALAAEHRWRVFYLGSKPDVVQAGAHVLRNRHPNLQIETHGGYFNTESASVENAAVLEAISGYAPHILMVGMGMPRQEHWVLRNASRLGANVILTCGACIDYFAGISPTPPRWMGAWGLEWTHRLYHDPVRLWRRYLVEPWTLVGPALREVLKRPGTRRDGD